MHSPRWATLSRAKGRMTAVGRWANRKKTGSGQQTIFFASDTIVGKKTIDHRRLQSNQTGFSLTANQGARVCLVRNKDNHCRASSPPLPCTPRACAEYSGRRRAGKRTRAVPPGPRVSRAGRKSTREEGGEEAV